jgi:hypothetical protein
MSHGELLVECEHFRVDKWTLEVPRTWDGGRFAVFTVISGAVECAGRAFMPGDFFLVPPTMEEREIKPTQPGSTVLRTMISERR